MNVIIMAGGAGTRFWPMSRLHRPKQFLTIIGSPSLTPIFLASAGLISTYASSNCFFRVVDLLDDSDNFSL